MTFDRNRTDTTDVIEGKLYALSIIKPRSSTMHVDFSMTMLSRRHYMTKNTVKHAKTQNYRYRLHYEQPTFRTASEIAGAVIGGVSLLAIIGAIVVCCLCCMRRHMVTQGIRTTGTVQPFEKCSPII